MRHQFRLNLKLTQIREPHSPREKQTVSIANDRETLEPELVGLKTDGIYTVRKPEVPNVCSVDPRLFAQQVSGVFSEIVRTSVLSPSLLLAAVVVV